ncbi:hypothetical protein Tco_0084786 [Tanacetum coccineum]
MYQWAEKTVPVAEGSSETTTERYMENYKNVSQDIQDQLNAEAEAVQIILTGIDNDIYSTVDACPNSESRAEDDTRSQDFDGHSESNTRMKSIRDRNKSTKNLRKSTCTLSSLLLRSRTATVTEDEEMSKEKED